MADPIKQLDHVTKGLRRLLTQFRGQPNFEAILTSYLNQIDELECMFIDLMIKRYLDNAEGAQLDGIGDIVGELRAGRNDTDYRAAIRGRIRANRGKARVEDILFVFGLLLPTFTFKLTEGPSPASLVVQIVEPLGPSDPSPEVIVAQLKRARGGGINYQLQWTEQPVADTFMTADGTVLQADSQRGTSDPGMTFGGYLSGATK